MFKTLRLAFKEAWEAFLKRWRLDKSIKEWSKESIKTELIDTLSDPPKILKIEVPKPLQDQGVLEIRKCYPDRYGDIGPGDDNPDNWKS